MCIAILLISCVLFSTDMTVIVEKRTTDMEIRHTEANRPTATLTVQQTGVKNVEVVMQTVSIMVRDEDNKIVYLSSRV